MAVTLVVGKAYRKAGGKVGFGDLSGVSFAPGLELSRLKPGTGQEALF